MYFTLPRLSRAPGREMVVTVKVNRITSRTVIIEKERTAFHSLNRESTLMSQLSNGSSAQNKNANKREFSVQDVTSERMRIEEWLAVRKEAGLQIDPDTAEVDWDYGQILDPYGVRSDLPKETYCVGRVYFARSPGSDVWVCFYDLPAAVSKALWEKIESGSARWAPELPDFSEP